MPRISRRGMSFKLSPSSTDGVETACMTLFSGELADRDMATQRIGQREGRPWREEGEGGEGGRGYKGWWSVVFSRDRWLASFHRERVGQARERERQNERGRRLEGPMRRLICRLPGRRACRQKCREAGKECVVWGIAWRGRGEVERCSSSICAATARWS